MAEITFTIPNDKLSRVVTAIKGLHPIPNNQDGTPQYTDNEWAKEYVRRHIIDTVYRYEAMLAKQNINVVHDDEIAS